MQSNHSLREDRRIASPLQVGTLVVLAILASCQGRRSEPATPPSSESTPPTESSLPWSRPGLLEAAGPMRPDFVPSQLPSHRVRQAQIDDPHADGWDTEVWSSRTQAALSRVASWFLATDSLDVMHVASVVDESFTGSALVPSEIEEVFEAGGLRVRRARVSGLRRDGERHRGRAGFVAAAGALAQRLAGHEAHVKVKTWGIQRQGEELATRVYFSADHSEGYEQNATWECRWIVQGDRPLLVQLQVVEYEEIEARLPAGRMFADCTESVFRNVPAYARQIRPSIHGWLQSIDISVDPDFEGMQGVSVADVNGDGLEDVYLCQGGGLPNRLLLQNPDGSVHDASARSGLDWIETTRCALFADFDNDGDQDVALTTDEALLLLANDGTARFTEQLRFPELTLGFALSAADYDADGHLDLYVCRHFSEAHKAVGQLPSPVPYHDANNGGRNALLHNDGGWRFRDATAESGLDANNRRWSYAAAWEDYDNDGDMDLYVANDFGRNNLYRNDGGRFVDVAAAAGVEDVASGMSVTWGDYDEDGWMDLYVSNMFSSAGSRITYQRQFQSDATDETKGYYQRLARGNSLFRNQGDGTFQDVSVDAGVTMGRWAWGSRFVDLDNDGREDLVVANGYITGDDTGDL